MNLEPVIGLEIHIQLKTKSKMFCSCANIFGDVKPNSAICPICMGYPGTLPVPNEQAIKWAQLIGAALNCKLAKKSKFDRKSYFYPDLPKAYQISQYDQPFCGRGSISISVGKNKIEVGITRVHLEEDAAKNIHPQGANYTLIDYNRAGTPLVEVVTEPDIRTPAQAKKFLQELRRVIRTLDVSDADMEKGQLRCDANISIREQGTTRLNPKTEIKNLNSFRYVEKALQYEIERQTKLYETGKMPQYDTTRGYNTAAGKTIEQRSKEEAADYRYFPEPDIPPFQFTGKELRQIQVALPELPYAKHERLVRQYGISDQQAGILSDNPTLSNFLENTASEIEQLSQDLIEIDHSQRQPLINNAANIIIRDLRELIIKEKLSEQDLKITPANFAEMVVLLYLGKMNKSATARILAEMQKSGGDPDHILHNLGLEQVSDTGDLAEIIQQVINENQKVVTKVKAGKDSAIQFLVGRVMAATRGKANPSVVIELLEKKLRSK